MKIAVFWNLTPYILVEIAYVSEELAAVINLVDKRKTLTDSSTLMMDVVVPAKHWYVCSRLYRAKSHVTAF
jgi:hypothetical protein